MLAGLQPTRQLHLLSLSALEQSTVILGESCGLSPCLALSFKEENTLSCLRNVSSWEIQPDQKGVEECVDDGVEPRASLFLCLLGGQAHPAELFSRQKGGAFGLM